MDESGGRQIEEVSCEATLDCSAQHEVWLSEWGMMPLAEACSSYYDQRTRSMGSKVIDLKLFPGSQTHFGMRFLRCEDLYG